MAQAKRRSRLVLTLLVGGFVLAALLAAFWPRPLLVDLGTVTRGAMRLTIDEEGRTRVSEPYVVSTPVAGRLQRVEVNPGDPVVRGETIIVHMLPTNPVALDMRTREQALAAVQAAKAALRGAHADLAAAEASRDLAQIELQRTEQLAARNIASSAALDRDRREFRISEAAVQMADAAIATREADLVTAEAQLIGFEDLGMGAALQNGRADDIPLHAPASGLILQVMQQSETTLPAGSPIMEIGDIEGDLEIVVDLISSDAVQVKRGDPVVITDWGGPKTLKGSVTRIDPFGMTKVSALGVEEQRVPVIIALDSPPEDRSGLGHGYRVETRIVVWQANDVLQVPSSALFRAGDAWSVFLAQNGTAHQIPVEIGKNNGVEAELTGGLTDGASVIIYPSAAVQDGAAIAPRIIE
ncbi:HlyD family efflux transporter periplasmic adaptor subunit [Pseudophaeobacter sp.]|uniref:efflux RND transporter periplasmic adaptor subunit n=1 Tax=Pseudophaeobacter sp. TaxID=1971739 RepID=UPI003299E1D4